MASLFDEPGQAPDPKTVPLPERMRPRTLDEVEGQEELIGPGRPLREAIERRVSDDDRAALAKN